VTKARICVLGSCNMDLVAYAERAPRLGETVRGLRFETIPGGKGANQAIAAARAGGAVAMVGAVGADHHGAALRDTLRSAGVDTAAVREVPEETTGTAHITVDETGANAIVVVPGANGTVTALTADDEAAVAAGGALLMQLELPLEAAIAGAAVARRHGVRVVLTPAPVSPLPGELLADVDLLVANEHEAAELCARPGSPRPAEGAGSEFAGSEGGGAGAARPEDFLGPLLDRVPEAIVTLGAAGCLYGSRDGRRIRMPAPRVAVVDTTAAGDSFVGAVAVALAEGMPMETALRWGIAAGALSVGRAGASTSMPDRAEIERMAATLG
jgi:ribokinase